MYYRTDITAYSSPVETLWNPLKNDADSVPSVHVFFGSAVTETLQQKADDAERQKRQKIKNLIRAIMRKLEDFAGVDLNCEEEAKLLREVRDLGGHVRALEEMLSESGPEASEAREFEDEGFFEADEESHVE
ncbi:hypothetical protein FKW77_006227 [Venturia effusa]|uniref:Uncharacterized protein n=1 Tax=Venturia effusa TaxID=50376 RepID=A0A517LDV2_9PEZI|nr:hypothetical protein FKW77_006227 [Venturia effusa]